MKVERGEVWCLVGGKILDTNHGCAFVFLRFAMVGNLAVRKQKD